MVYDATTGKCLGMLVEVDLPGAEQSPEAPAAEPKEARKARSVQARNDVFQDFTARMRVSPEGLFASIKGSDSITELAKQLNRGQAITSYHLKQLSGGGTARDTFVYLKDYCNKRPGAPTTPALYPVPDANGQPIEIK